MTLKIIVSSAIGAVAGMVLMRARQQLRPAASAAPGAVSAATTRDPEDCPGCK